MLRDCCSSCSASVQGFYLRSFRGADTLFPLRMFRLGPRQAHGPMAPVIFTKVRRHNLESYIGTGITTGTIAPQDNGNAQRGTTWSAWTASRTEQHPTAAALTTVMTSNPTLDPTARATRPSLGRLEVKCRYGALEKP